VIFPQGRTCFCGPAGDVEKVFDSDRNAMQRAEVLAVVQQCIEPTSFEPSTCRIDHYPGAQPAFEQVDTLQATIDQFDSRQFAATQVDRRLGDRWNVAHHAYLSYPHVPPIQ
jgi:hypothetical protein